MVSDTLSRGVFHKEQNAEKKNMKSITNPTFEIGMVGGQMKRCAHLRFVRESKERKWLTAQPQG